MRGRRGLALLAALCLASCEVEAGDASSKEPCEASTDCPGGLCVVAGTCVEPCADEADCPDGWRCAELVPRNDPPESVRGCVARVNPPKSVTVAHELRPAALAGRVGGDTVVLPPATGTTVVVLQPVSGGSPELHVLTARLSTEPLFDVSAVGDESPAPRNPVHALGVPLTLLLPSGPEPVSSAPGFDLIIRASAPSDLRLTYLSRVEPGAALDLDLFYVGVDRLQPQGLRGPPEVAEALDEVERVYAPAQIVLGEVRQHAVGGELGARYTVLERERGEIVERNALLALSAGSGRPSVAVFLVSTVEGAVGLSGGIPGPATMHGTPGSGVVVGVDGLAAADVPTGLTLGRALAPELGHFLGLFHTSERDGTVLDPFPDTPACRTDRDADDDGLLQAPECDGAGADNLMFWNGVGTELSPQQRAVLRWSLVLR
jgi:hypothetical protein